MNIAIIGGGAAGIITAYLLDKKGHAVTVYEKKNSLGGHIRTGQQNQNMPGLPAEISLEGGVVEFSAAFTRFRRLMKELEVAMVPVDIGTALFTSDGTSFLSPLMIKANRRGHQKIPSYIRLLGLQLAATSCWLKTRKLSHEDLYTQSMADYLGKASILHSWLKCFTMYSYSIPFKHIRDVPAQLGIPSIRDYMMADWFRIEGGVYSYVRKILDRFKGHIHTDSRITGVERNHHGVRLHSRDGNPAFFDRVVIATPPDQVLDLLMDASPDEKRRFADWKGNHIRTFIHTDAGIYRKHFIASPSEFDFFQTPSGWGYNACLNHLCGLEEDSQRFFLSFNLEELVDPSQILHVQEHHTPLYTVDAFRYRDEIISRNGEGHCYFAGAYLGDGLHEGAVVSAERVAEML